MEGKSLFKSKEGKEAIFELYDGKLDELDIDFEYKVVETSFGKTNLICTGNPSNPPIILVHGSNGCAPIALEVYPNLTEKFQVFSVDVLAQPNKSAETRLSMKDDSYGKWMHEVIDALELEEVTMAGFSFGGLVILKTLEHKEDRIKQVFLTAPAYIVNGNPFKAVFKMFIPMKQYMRSQKPKYLEKFLSAVFTDRDQFAIDFLSKVFVHFDMDFSPIPVISKAAAKAIKTPITLIGAKHDVIFPGEKMIKRAKKIFPALKYSQLLENSKHVQNSDDNLRIQQLVLNS